MVNINYPKKAKETRIKRELFQPRQLFNETASKDYRASVQTSRRKPNETKLRAEKNPQRQERRVVKP